MRLYRIKWGDRYDTHLEWFGTQRDMIARRAELGRLSTKRPYDQLDLLYSGPTEIPTDKAGLLDWLNSHCKG